MSDATQKFQNFDLLGPRGSKRGPKTKIFQLIYNQGPKIYVILSFERPSLNNKKIQNFDHFGTTASFFGGALNQNSVPTEILAMVRTTHSENLKALAKKLKEEIDFNQKPCF